MSDHKKLLSNAYRLSMVNLALRMAALSELFLDHTEKETGEMLEQRVQTLYGLISRHFSGDPVLPADVIALRDENIADMVELSAQTDIFQNDEYVLNRIEYTFRDAEPVPDDQAFTDEIIGYFAGVPKESQNEAIIDVIEQLPFRMTKVRFLELLRDRLGVYKGSESSVFTDRLDMLTTAAGIHHEDALFPEIPADQLLSAPVFEVKTLPEFEALEDSLMRSGEQLDLRMDVCSSMEDVLNSFLCVLLTEADHAQEFDLRDHVTELVLKLSSSVLDPQPEGIRELYPDFEPLEGYPERFSTDLMGLLSREFDDDLLKQVSVLLSSSPFAPLCAREKSEELTNEEFRKLYGAFSEKILARLSSVNKLYGRAIMARMNAMVPPRFTSQEELENYIFSSLRGCTNTAEKAGVAELLHRIMKEG